MPLDQRPDDGRSLTFDTEPLAERLEILGAPVVELDLAADEPERPARGAPQRRPAGRHLDAR